MICISGLIQRENLVAGDIGYDITEVNGNYIVVGSTESFDFSNKKMDVFLIEVDKNAALSPVYKAAFILFVSGAILSVIAILMSMFLSKQIRKYMLSPEFILSENPKSNTAVFF